ncbi:DUF2500 family protein [Paenibacillus soyae]|uniref:DUF2500 family protein n=1 Tax=Paenibacillus soyae TaxID=2969249 RepID=A0A9X2S9I1_9BACL|nr:DUF2500 family protein [Paenibacillus soyae]MCR2802777.1 DUF2500 family protein [Paenibacillus soyae]
MTIERIAALCMIIIISSLFGLMIYRDRQIRRREEKLAIEIARAKVIRKREETIEPDRRIPKVTLYFVTFEVRGEAVEFPIKSDVRYEELRVGQEGILHFKRKNWSTTFLAFHEDGHGRSRAYGH